MGMDGGAAIDDERPGVAVVAVGVGPGGSEALAAVLDVAGAAAVVVAAAPGVPLPRSRLPSVEIADDMPLQPGRIHLAPAELEVGFAAGRFATAPRPPAGPRAPNDRLLRALAGPACLGALVGDPGADGIYGVADFILGPAAIASEIARLLGGEAPRVQGLARVIDAVRAAFGVDLAAYAPAAIERRIGRRMRIAGTTDSGAYLRLLDSRPRELEALHKDCLRGPARFFRDPTTAAALARLLEGRRSGSAFRVWVPGCGAGEDAYSIAILALEILEDHGPDVRLQIFGSDLDIEAVQRARRGIYPSNIAIDVSPARLQRFFMRRDDEYQIARRVRDLVRFTQHDAAEPPPFGELDLVAPG